MWGTIQNSPDQSTLGGVWKRVESQKEREIDWQKKVSLNPKRHDAKVIPANGMG